jgi:hypothetical protein
LTHLDQYGGADVSTADDASKGKPPEKDPDSIMDQNDDLSQVEVDNLELLLKFYPQMILFMKKLEITWYIIIYFHQNSKKEQKGFIPSQWI